MSGGGPHRRRNGKGHGGGHHGGAWKVAYADFVTAMMAFFLLLWLLNAVSQEQLEGISDYFSPINKHTSTSGGGGLLAGNVVAAKGVFESRDPSVAHRRSHPVRNDGLNPNPDAADMEEEDTEEAEPLPQPSPPAKQKGPAISDQAQFAEVENAIRKGLERNPEMKTLAKSLIVEETPEGLRIQIVDQDGVPMFPSGEAVMYQYTRKILELVVNAIRTMPQHIEVAGHTDAKPFANPSGYGNWELSSDRANAARRALVEMGLAEGRIDKVVGQAATVPLFPEAPEAPGNRRLSITLLRGTGVS
ncbi:MAG: flagellar motor protein MotB [Rhodospirillales bacterium]